MTERRAQGAAPDAFKRDLVAVIPHLRAFARGLCGRPDFADDLVQETMVRAWNARERFRPDTSMKAWTFVILRNAFLSEVRRNRFRGDYDEVAAERITAGAGGQEAPLHLADLHRALQNLPPERREAVLLVGAGGFSYEEAAQIAGCAVGTIKSRVARGRAALTRMTEGGEALGGVAGEGDAAGRIMADLAKVVAAG
ncbi:MAG TPA: sigma-70 family RNA polymerase sigma factor [Novosphingobium sp.]|nr:sigma-70 family RNA polymerase sigma factor [Novosphingobium sp.]